MIDINIEQAEQDSEHFFLRANAKGKPEYVEQTINDITHTAIKVADKLYIIKK